MEQLKPMTPKQRFEHIWEYYIKEYWWVAMLVVVAFSVVTMAIVGRFQNTMVSGMLVNIGMDQKGYNYLTEDYLEDLGGEPPWDLAELNYSNFGSLLDPENAEANYNASMQLIARVSGGMLDYMILDKYSMEYYITVEVYMDLREFFSEEELAALDAENRIIYAIEEGQTDRMPVAVDITELPFTREYITNEGSIYFALSGNTKRPEMRRDAWERITGWTKEN